MEKDLSLFFLQKKVFPNSVTIQDAVLAVKAGEARSSNRPQSPVGTLDIKVVLLGDPAVGKTSLFFRIFRDEFTELYKATIGVDFCLIGACNVPQISTFSLQLLLMTVILAFTISVQTQNISCQILAKSII